MLRQEVRLGLDLVASIREGLRLGALDHVLGAGDLRPDVHALVASAASLRRRRREGVRLSPTAPDRLVRVLRVVVHAGTAIGSREDARRWLRGGKAALAEKRPLDLLRSDTGCRIVESVLDRISLGISS